MDGPIQEISASPAHPNDSSIHNSPDALQQYISTSPLAILAPPKKTKELNDLPIELLIKIAQQTWLLQLEQRPESRPYIHSLHSSDEALRPNLPITKAMPLILVNKRFYDASIAIPYEEVRIDGRLYIAPQFHRSIRNMDALFNRIDRPESHMVNLVKSVDLEINFEQPAIVQRTIIEGLKAFKALKHLRITVKLSLYRENADYRIPEECSTSPEKRFLFLLHDKSRFPGTYSGTHEAETLLQFFDLDLETLTIRFHSCTTTELPTGDVQFVPDTNPPVPVGLNDPLGPTREVEGGCRLYFQWFQEDLAESKVYEIVGEGQEVDPEDTTGLSSSFKGRRYTFPLKKGTRPTECPNWPLFEITKPTPV